MIVTRRAHWGWYVLLGALAAHVLIRASGRQIYDTNFYVLWEAIALMAGDHPYRDFFQFGSPLLTAVTTLVQWAVGYRLIGEFAIHWAFLIASVLAGFHLAVRLSRSVTAALITSLLVVAALAATPTFSFPKLFFYPVAVLLGWWYMDRPGVRRAAALGLITAVAFLYRHDHGVYIGVASVLAFVLARVTTPALRSWATAIREVAAYGVIAAVVIAPWAAVVEANEGFADYVRMRAEWNRTWAPDRSAFLILSDFNPAPVLQGRPFNDDEPLAQWLPPREAAEHWLAQISLVVPILVILSSALEVVRRRRRGLPIDVETCRPILAAGLALIVADRLFRQDSYFLSSMPLTAALGAGLLARPQAGTHLWRAVRSAIGIAFLLVTTLAVLGFVDELWLLEPVKIADIPISQLVSSPPIDGFQPASAARELEPAVWNEMDADRKQRVMMRYMHDCTRDGDRILVTGSTPYQVGYYVNRPIAGGHLQWHHRWRSDPAHEMQSLGLIERQSVPFAFSTHDPVLDDFKAYPRIHEYLSKNYQEVEGSNGLLLVDRRREATGTFGRVAFPCFR
jgi:hypothetical protein